MASLEETERTLEDVQNHFSSWRVKRPRPKQIPEELWDEAIGLLSQYTLCRVAKALRLEENTFKGKAKAAGVEVLVREKRPAARATMPTFFETNLETVVGKTQTHQNQQEWKVSVRRSDGVEMTISGGELSESALQKLVNGFCQGGV